MSASDAPPAEHPAQVELGVGADQGLRQRLLLDQEEPVIVGGGKRLIDVPEHGAGRHDVEHAQLLDPLGVVERHAVRDAAAAVVAGDHEAVEAELGHRRDLVGGGRALAVAGVVVAVGGMAAVAVAAQVAGDHGEALGQPGRHLVPHEMGLRIAVQQQERRPRASAHQVDLALRGGDARFLEPLEGHRFSSSWCLGASHAKRERAPLPSSRARPP
jgi:hypothetical protein